MMTSHTIDAERARTGTAKLNFRFPVMMEYS
jgi:hypothetical protein